MDTKTYQAAKFLVNTLSENEVPSTEVYRRAEKTGISRSTLRRAYREVFVKARKSSKRWFMYISPDQKEQAEKSVDRLKSKAVSERSERCFGLGQISSDWIAVVADGAAWEVPGRKTSDAGLHIKIGDYEFEAAAGFPMEKLAELLRGLGGEGLC